ncbi:jg4430 [Pararge aegeria aegeria]|uniref:Jg4430 protein n=1 Tax=Pararge aegeria aegeria TaxID=348720 RepID=A0A8S4R3M1_9NEOP|nr:jg4430 [Pararge aegeria aegeria]
MVDDNGQLVFRSPYTPNLQSHCFSRHLPRAPARRWRPAQTISPHLTINQTSIVLEHKRSSRVEVHPLKRASLQDSIVLQKYYFDTIFPAISYAHIQRVNESGLRCTVSETYRY